MTSAEVAICWIGFSVDKMLLVSIKSSIIVFESVLIWAAVGFVTSGNTGTFNKVDFVLSSGTANSVMDSEIIGRIELEVPTELATSLVRSVTAFVPESKVCTEEIDVFPDGLVGLVDQNVDNVFRAGVIVFAGAMLAAVVMSADTAGNVAVNA